MWKSVYVWRKLFEPREQKSACALSPSWTSITTLVRPPGVKPVSTMALLGVADASVSAPGSLPCSKRKHRTKGQFRTDSVFGILAYAHVEPAGRSETRHQCDHEATSSPLSDESIASQRVRALSTPERFTCSVVASRRDTSTVSALADMDASKTDAATITDLFILFSLFYCFSCTGSCRITIPQFTFGIVANPTLPI